jgi:hypothetical protein
VSEADERTPPPVPADPVPSDAAARRVPALYRAGVFVLATVAGVLGFRAAWWLIGQQLRAPLTSPVPALLLIM